MASGGGGENRLKAYKLKGLNVEEVRRRREEEGIQLRKSRRDEQVRRRGKGERREFGGPYCQSHGRGVRCACAGY